MSKQQEHLQALYAAAENVNLPDAAGKIIGNPTRNAMCAPTGVVLALAHAYEDLHALALETEVLVRALARPTFSGDEAADQERDALIERQAETIRNMITTMRGQPAPAEEL